MDDWGGDDYEVDRQDDEPEAEPVVVMRPRIVRGTDNAILDTPASAGNRRSILFPQTEISLTGATSRPASAAVAVGFENKWPQLILAASFCIGGVLLIAFGITCLRFTYLAAIGTPPPGGVCAGVNQDGGVAMLIIGLVVFPLSVWQVFVHRPKRVFKSGGAAL